VLAQAHQCLHAVAVLLDCPCPQDLRREVLRVGVEVAHETLEVRGFGSGGEGCAAPVVDERAGQAGCGWREAFEDQLSLTEARGIGGGKGEEGVWGPMLPDETGLNCAGVCVEGGNVGGGGLCEQETRCVEEEQQAAEDGYFSRAGHEAFHEPHSARF